MNNIIYVRNQAEAATKGYKYSWFGNEGEEYWFPDRKNFGLFIREQKPNDYRFSDKSLFYDRMKCYKGAYFEKVFAIIMKEHPELLEDLPEDIYDIMYSC